MEFQEELEPFRKGAAGEWNLLERMRTTAIFVGFIQGVLS
jgi:hypothetical protein